MLLLEWLHTQVIVDVNARVPPLVLVTMLLSGSIAHSLNVAPKRW